MRPYICLYDDAHVLWSHCGTALHAALERVSCMMLHGIGAQGERGGQGFSTWKREARRGELEGFGTCHELCEQAKRLAEEVEIGHADRCFVSGLYLPGISDAPTLPLKCDKRRCMRDINPG